MEREFFNRLGRHRKTVKHLDMDGHKEIWLDKPPKVFSSTVALLRAEVGAFGGDGAAQTVPVSWEEQNREEKELEDLAFPLSNALYDCYLDAGREADAAEWEMTATDWRKLNEQSLLDKSKRLIDQLTAMLAATPSVAADYNISGERITDLDKEWRDYAEVIGAPGARRAGRAALTGSMRARMRVIDGLAAKLDRHVVGFRGTPAGNLFVDGYFIARRVDDLGGSGGESPPADGGPTPPP